MPNPPYASIQQTFAGNRDLGPERLELFEIAHHARRGRLSTTLTAFHYHIEDIIATNVITDPTAPPVFQVVQSFVNEGSIEAWGGEAAAELHLSRRMRGFFNYSYQGLEGETSFPRHKLNGGLRYSVRGWNANVTAHWVDSSTWPVATTPGRPRATVDSYTLVDGSVGYEFSGRLRGFGVGLSAFNMLNRQHYQILPAQSDFEQGQNGERVGSRWLMTISYRVF